MGKRKQRRNRNRNNAPSVTVEKNVGEDNVSVEEDRVFDSDESHVSAISEEGSGSTTIDVSNDGEIFGNNARGSGGSADDGSINYSDDVEMDELMNVNTVLRGVLSEAKNYISSLEKSYEIADGNNSDLRNNLADEIAKNLILTEETEELEEKCRRQKSLLSKSIRKFSKLHEDNLKLEKNLVVEKKRNFSLEENNSELRKKVKRLVDRVTAGELSASKLSKNKSELEKKVVSLKDEKSLLLGQLESMTEAYERKIGEEDTELKSVMLDNSGLQQEVMDLRQEELECRMDVFSREGEGYVNAEKLRDVYISLMAKFPAKSENLCRSMLSLVDGIKNNITFVTLERVFEDLAIVFPESLELLTSSMQECQTSLDEYNIYVSLVDGGKVSTSSEVTSSVGRGDEDSWRARAAGSESLGTQTEVMRR